MIQRCLIFKKKLIYEKFNTLYCCFNLWFNNSTTVINDGQWHHVAVTYDDRATDKACIYIDGILDTCRNFTQPVNTSSVSPILIGRRNDMSNYFQGSIDEVRIWDVARTGIQISRFMSREYCDVPNGLIAYYKFEEGVAGVPNAGNTSVIDYAGTNNGTLTNFSLAGNSSNWAIGFNPNTFQIPKTINQNMDSLIYNTPNVNSYKWYNCDSNIFYPADTNHYFVPSASGNYAVLVEIGSCIDTSDCYNYSLVGIQKKNIENLYQLQGNLIHEKVEILVNSTSKLNFQLLDIQGKVISDKQTVSSTKIVLEMPETLGLYFLRVFDQQGNSKTHKLIKVNK